MFKPSLEEAISLAHMRDEQIVHERKITRPLLFNQPPLKLSILTKSKPTTPLKLISWEQMRRRHAQCLSFNQDEKYFIGHKCRGLQLLFLEENFLDDGEDGDGIDAILIGFPPKLEISLHALTRQTIFKTMRVSARIGQYEVMVLFNSGSTHNFISEKQPSCYNCQLSLLSL